MIDINAAIAAEVATGPDMTKATAGGGERTIAAEGPVRLRFVGYVEIGKHVKTTKGVKKELDQVQLTFELSGKNHPPIEIDGKKYPQRIVVTENKSLNEKANFFKLFQTMNYAQKATHMAQLLGEAYLGEVSHYKFKGAAGEDVVIPQLRGANGYTIKAPRLLDPATEEYVLVQVAAAESPLKFFFWNTATKEQWDLLFVDGMYEERKDKEGKVTAPAKSKNVTQLKIRSALNFDGSPIDTVLKTNGIKLDLPTASVDDDEVPEQQATTTAAAVVPQGAAATDALAGIVG